MKRFLKRASKLIFSRTLIFILMLLVQIAIIGTASWYLTRIFPVVYVAFNVLGAVVLIFIINKDEPAEFKLTWAVITLFAPIVGVLLYGFNSMNWGMIRLKHKADKEINSTKDLISSSEGTKAELLNETGGFQRFAYYMENVCGHPVYHNTRVTYFDIGEKALRDMIEELKTAKNFIFLEYFIISEGRIWSEILEILKEKASSGVEVKVMYDGLCSLFSLPYHYPKKLAKYGIEAKMFAPIIPFLSTTQNNRDHRKITVIDGRVAYTGGVNLADEYANLEKVYGHWKDVAVKVEGRAVMSFSRMFLQNWNLYGKEDVDYGKYLEKRPDRPHFEHDGYIIPYADAPIVQYEIGKRVYEAVFSHAENYVHVMTPYFIVDREFLSMIKFTALRGIDVKLILPHIPDKKTAFALARSFYPELLEAGVKIYEYTPGFVHAKVSVSDNLAATVGSVNLDYRSFYHHFENGVFMYGSSAVLDIEKDFEKTLEKCIEVDMNFYRSTNLFFRGFGRVLRFIAPLM